MSACAHTVLGVAGLVLAFQGTAAACGICVEDKIAAVYDHAIVTQALGRKHYVAFFLIDGPLVPGAGMRRAIEALAGSAHGVDKGSVRVSVEAASLAMDAFTAFVKSEIEKWAKVVAATGMTVE